MSRPFMDPAIEDRLLDEVAQRRARLRATALSVTPQRAQLAGQYAQAYSWMDPTVIQSFVQAGIPADDPRVQQIATTAAEQASEEGQFDTPAEDMPDAWYETLVNVTLGWAKPIVRTGFTALMVPLDELQALASSAWTALFDETEAGEAGLVARRGDDGGVDFTLFENIGKVLGELADPASLVSDFWTNYTEKAARSSGVLALGDLLQGKHVDLGQGFLPGGEIWEERERAKHRLSLDGQFMTPGRGLARIFTEPGSTQWQVVSGLNDAAQGIILDPTAKAGRVVGEAMHLRRTFQTTGLISGIRRTIDPERAVSQFLTGSDGQKMVRELTENQDIYRAWNLTGRADPQLAQRLVDASDEATTFGILEDVLGTVIRERPTTRFINRQTGQTTFGNLFGRGAKVATGENSRIGFLARTGRLRVDMPAQTISMHDPNDAAIQLDRWMRNAQMPEAQRAARIGEVLRVTPDDEVGFYTAGMGVSGAVEDHLIEAWGVRQSDARRMTQLFDKLVDDHRAFDVTELGAHVDVLAPLRVQVEGEVIDARPTSGMVSELLSDTIHIPDPREIRRATPIVSQMQRLYTSGLWKGSVDFADLAVGTVWKPFQILRGAYFTRVSGEEQMRLAGAGYDSMFSHPFSAIAWMLSVDPKSKLGRRLAAAARQHIDPKGTMTLKGEGFADLVEHTAAMSRGAAGHAGLPGEILTGRYLRARQGDIGFYPGWATELAHEANDITMRRVAGGLFPGDLQSIGRGASGSNFDDVAEWWWRGSGKGERIKLGRMEGRSKLLTDRQAADNYLRQNYFDRLEKFTGGDPDLVELVAKGRLGGVDLSGGKYTGKLEPNAVVRAADRENYGKIVSIDGDNARVHFVSPDGAEATVTLSTDLLTPIKSKPKGVDVTNFGHETKLARLLEDSYSASAPAYVKTPDVVNLRGVGARASRRLNRATDRAFDALMSRPTNFLSRSPAFRQAYWKRVEELIGSAPRPVQVEMLKAARAANIGSDRIGAMASAAAKSQGDRITSLDDADILARAFGLSETKKLLYDLQKRSQFFDAARLVFPFGEAWKEIITSWTRILRQNPATIRRFHYGLEGVREPSIFGEPETTPGTGRGFFYTDEATGQEVFAYPMSWVGKMLGVQQESGAGLTFTGNVSGLNLVSATVLPGFGPLVQIPASHLIPNTPQWQDLEEILLPFGRERSLIDAFTPAWIDKLRTAFSTPDPQHNRQFGNTVMSVMSALQATGRYDLTSRGGQQRLIEDATAKARILFLIRGAAQFGVPTGPGFSWSTSDLEGNVIPVTILGDDLRRLTEEMGGDREAAFQEWIKLYGVENVLATMSKSVSLVERPVTEKGDAWLRAHPDLEQAFEATVGFFAPEDAVGDFDYGAFNRQFETGAREGLSPEQFLGLANDFLGRVQFENAKKIAALRPGPEMSLWLAQIRMDLAEQYPGFDGWVADSVWQRKPSTEQLIEELGRAVLNPTIAETDAGRGTRLYLSAIGVASQMVLQLPGNTRHYQQAKSAAPIRFWLRMVARQIIEEHPDFARVWTQVFERELADDGLPATA